jgi:hypothetical protein
MIARQCSAVERESNLAMSMQGIILRVRDTVDESQGEDGTNFSDCRRQWSMQGCVVGREI